MTASCMEFSSVSSVWRLFSTAVKSFFQLARSFIERRGHVRNLVGGRFLNSRRQIAGRHALGKIGDAQQPASDRLRRNERQQQRQQCRDSQRRFHQIGREFAGWPRRIALSGYAMRTAPPGMGTATYSSSTPTVLLMRVELPA